MPTDAELVERMEEIRTRNNGHWMSLLKLALEVAPDRAKAIIAQIDECDSQVTQIWKDLAKS